MKFSGLSRLKVLKETHYSTLISIMTKNTYELFNLSFIFKSMFLQKNLERTRDKGLRFGIKMILSLKFIGNNYIDFKINVYHHLC